MLAMALCAASTAFVASAAFAADLTAAQIAEKNAAARGGLAAWRAVQSMSMSGEMDVGGKTDAKVPYTMSLKRPHMSRLEIRFENQTSVQTFDGKQGWKYRPYLGRTEAEPLTAAELKSAQEADDLDGALIDAERKGTRVELQGMDKVEGKSAYKLKLTKASGASRNLWVDAASLLEVKIDGEPRKLDGRPHKVAVFFRDYKTVNGLNIPHTLETVVEGVKATRKIVVKSVTVNPKLDDALFGKPVPTAPAPAAGAADVKKPAP
jgi:outer membrane lipoprotein-sorting protein